MAKSKASLEEITEYWKLYELGKNHHNEMNLYESTAEAYRFYEGDQWHGIEYGSDRLSTMNFITPTIEYKSAMISMQNMQIMYNAQDLSNPGAEKVCKILNKYAARRWEKQKLDSKLWAIAKDACIAGDSYIYFYNKNLDSQIIDNTSIYFADEQQPDIQKQEYIVIYERRPVADVRRDAKKNKVPQKDIELILADQETDTTVGETNEVNTQAETGKCSCLLYLTKDENGNVQFCRSTRNVVYEPLQTVNGLTLYPIASYVWTRKKNSSRGIGEVRPLIPNQIEANKILFRRSVSVKQNAFAKPVYVENAIDNPSDIDKVGKAIKIRGSNVQKVNDIFAYVPPAPMSQEAGLLQTNIIDMSRVLAGAGDAAMGNIDPERTSGAAILAMKDQSAIPLNEQMAFHRQFVEDIALIWFDMWKAYYKAEPMKYAEIVDVPGLINAPGLPNTNARMLVSDEIAPGELDGVDVDIKIDATPTNPFSKYALEQSLEQARNSQLISFAEYVKALPENSIAPKHKFEEILKAREAQPQLPGPDMGQGTNGTNIPSAQGGTGAVPTSIPTASVMPTK